MRWSEFLSDIDHERSIFHNYYDNFDGLRDMITWYGKWMDAFL